MYDLHWPFSTPAWNIHHPSDDAYSKAGQKRMHGIPT